MERTISVYSDALPIVVEENYDPDVFNDSTDLPCVIGDIQVDPVDRNYALVESGNSEAHNQQFGDVSKRRRTRGSTFREFRAASLSVSMLAKPSDDRKAPTFLAGWNVSNLIQGTGILGIPYAVQQGGWAAVAMMFVVAVLCCHTGKLLIECMYETSKKTGVRRRLRINYPEVAEAVMGKKGYYVLATIQTIEMFGGVIMYIVLLATVWEDLLGEITHLNARQFAAINCCIALPSLIITKMSIISWLSMLSVFSLLSSLITLVVFCFFNVSSWTLNNIPEFNLQTFPVGFGIIVFSYCAHAVFPGIEGSMKKPQQFGTMMNSSFLLAALVKAALGTFMVLTFGIATKEVATTNMANYPIFSKVATCLVICNVLLAVPLGMFIVSSTLDEAMLQYFPRVNKDSKFHWVWLLISRTVVLGLALALAIIVPHFGLLMGVIGSFTGTCLCFLFPCYFHMKLRWESLSKFQVTVDIFIMIFGLIAGGLGLTFSTKALIMTYI